MLSFDQVREGLDVYDAAGEKIGQVDEIYAPAAGETTPTDVWTMRVDTGPLGLGYVEYHIPFSAIASVTDERVQLNAGRAQLPMLHRRENLVYPDDQPDRSTTTTPQHPADEKAT